MLTNALSRRIPALLITMSTRPVQGSGSTIGIITHANSKVHESELLAASRLDIIDSPGNARTVCFDGGFDDSIAVFYTVVVSGCFAALRFNFLNHLVGGAGRRTRTIPSTPKIIDYDLAACECSHSCHESRTTGHMDNTHKGLYIRDRSRTSGGE